MESDMFSPAHYTYLIAQKYAYVALIVGAMGWLAVGAFGTNPITALFGEGLVSRLLFILVGAAGLFFIARRDYYLPFLGEAVMPCGALKNRVPPGATTSITISTEPGAKILYWASEPATEELRHMNDWRVAYARFENAGVTTAGSDGTAILRVREPQAYTVPFRGRLEPHVHYRECANGGIIGRVNTVFLSGNKGVPMNDIGSGSTILTEGFQNPGATGNMKDAQVKHMMQTMSQAVPQINQILTNIQTQFSATMPAAAPAPSQEAFCTY